MTQGGTFKGENMTDKRIRYNQHITHYLSKGRYACGIGKSDKFTVNPDEVTCEKCKRSLAYKKAIKVAA